MSNTTAAAIPLTVQTLTGSTVVQELDFSEECSVGSVKDEICTVVGVPRRQQRLLWEAVNLEDGRLLRDIGLPASGACLQLVLHRPSEDQVEEVRQIIGGTTHAINSLDRKSVSELKCMQSPPAVVMHVLLTVMDLLVGIDPSIVVGPQGKAKDRTWLSTKKMIQNSSQFIKSLQSLKTRIDENKADERSIDAARTVLNQCPHLNPVNMGMTSVAAGALACWVSNIVRYSDILKKLREDFDDIESILAEIRVTS